MKGLFLPGILVIIAIAFAGCSNVPTIPEGQGSAQPGVLSPGPVVTMPVATAVDIMVMQKDPVYATVDVVFEGGNGQVMVGSCDVTFIRSDGTSETRQLKPEKGATVTFSGTKGTDRVMVTVTMKDGKSYHIIDQQVPYRTRG